MSGPTLQLTPPVPCPACGGLFTHKKDCKLGASKNTSAKIEAIGKPTVEAQTKQDLLDVLSDMTKCVVVGEVVGVIAVMIRPDRSFRIWQTGDIRRIETLGLLETVKHDLLHDYEEA